MLLPTIFLSEETDIVLFGRVKKMCQSFAKITIILAGTSTELLGTTTFKKQNMNFAENFFVIKMTELEKEVYV